VEPRISAELENILDSASLFAPELALAAGILLVVIAGLFVKRSFWLPLSACVPIAVSLTFNLLFYKEGTQQVSLFYGMLRTDDFSAYLRLLVDVGGVLTIVMSWMDDVGKHRDYRAPGGTIERQRLSSFHALVLAVILGSHLLLMSMNLLMVFISLELVSISSYVLTGFLFEKRSAEGSMKYFVFGSTASAIMLYGFSILYGLTGSLDFSSPGFATALVNGMTPLFFIGGLLALCGFLYKIAAAPLHPWVPDVYESAPMPVVAFFSVVPKLAGLGVLTKFVLMLTLFGQSPYDWQLLLGIIAILTITVGNFSALLQKDAKRLMAYSSIAQSGFLMVGIVAFVPQGIHAMLFYASIYLLMNFLVFFCLQYFESRGFTTIASHQSAGKNFLWPAIFLLLGMVSLTGLPPTAGFTAKFLIFSSLWESYHLSGKEILLWLLVFGLLNTVVALFYYLRIPYFAFIKNGSGPEKPNKTGGPQILSEGDQFSFRNGNFIDLILVLLILLFFFVPGLLMGWINKINFVL